MASSSLFIGTDTVTSTVSSLSTSLFKAPTVGLNMLEVLLDKTLVFGASGLAYAPISSQENVSTDVYTDIQFTAVTTPVDVAYVTDRIQRSLTTWISASSPIVLQFELRTMTTLSGSGSFTIPPPVVVPGANGRAPLGDQLSALFARVLRVGVDCDPSVVFTDVVSISESLRDQATQAILGTLQSHEGQDLVLQSLLKLHNYTASFDLVTQAGVSRMSLPPQVQDIRLVFDLSGLSVRIPSKDGTRVMKLCSVPFSVRLGTVPIIDLDAMTLPNTQVGSPVSSWASTGGLRGYCASGYSASFSSDASGTPSVSFDGAQTYLTLPPFYMNGYSTGGGHTILCVASLPSFPVSPPKSLPTGCVGFFDGDSWDASASVWRDRSSAANHASVVRGTMTTGTLASGLKYLSGGTTAGIQFPSGCLDGYGGDSHNYTIMAVARYTGANRQRIFDGLRGYYASPNWAAGFEGGKSGVAYHGGAGWITQNTVDLHGNDWVVLSDQLSLFRSQFVTRSTTTTAASMLTGQMTINWGNSGAYSDWAVAAVLFFKRSLTLAELQATEQWLYNTYLDKPDTVGLFDVSDCGLRSNVSISTVGTSLYHSTNRGMVRSPFVTASGAVCVSDKRRVIALRLTQPDVTRAVTEVFMDGFEFGAVASRVESQTGYLEDRALRGPNFVGRSNGHTGTRRLFGKLSQLQVYNGALSDAQLSYSMTRLRAKWGC